MILYSQRTEAEKEIIHKAYEFEKEAYINESYERNPYADAIMAMGLWEDLNVAIELWLGKA